MNSIIQSYKSCWLNPTSLLLLFFLQLFCCLPFSVKLSPQHSLCVTASTPSLKVCRMFFGALRMNDYWLSTWQSFLIRVMKWIFKGIKRRMSTQARVFQDASDLKYTVKVTKQRLKKKHINIMEWPGQFPDLEAIESP